MSKSKSAQEEYWNKKINEWSTASYGRSSQISTIEKIATYFRSVNKRKDAAIKLIAPLARNKTILDLGCGMGEFSLELASYKPKKIISIDISKNAIHEIKNLIKKRKIAGIIEPIVSDIRNEKKLPNCDIVVGLGFIDYLNKKELKHLFKLIGDKSYLFSYFEKKISLFNFLHRIYITLQKCPGAYKYSRAEIKKIIPQSTKTVIINKDGLQFITNIRFDSLDKNIKL